MSKISINVEILPEGSICIPFDNEPEAKYEIEVFPDEIETGDGVVLALNRQACIAFAKLFVQLSEQPEMHLHLGWDNDAPEGPGIRIIRNDSGKIDQKT
jgi:hypothetical protein